VNRYLTGIVFMLLSAAIAADQDQPGAPVKVSTLSGIEQKYADPSVRIQDDFYQHVNGTWLKTTEIPADKA